MTYAFCFIIAVDFFVEGPSFVVDIKLCSWLDVNFDFLALFLLKDFSGIMNQFLQLTGVITIHYKAKLWQIGEGLQFFLTGMGLCTVGLYDLLEEYEIYINVFGQSNNEKANTDVPRFGYTCSIFVPLAENISSQ